MARVLNQRKGKGIAIPLLYLTAITAAEVITALFSAPVGIVLHTILFLALIFHSSLVAGSPMHRLFLSLSLAPLIRILSLSIPLAGFSQIQWFFIVSIPMLAATFVVMWGLGFGAKEVGFTPGKIPLQLLIGTTGVGFGLLEYQILKPESLISSLGWQELALPALVLLVSTGFAEEFAFRGVMQRASSEAVGEWGFVYIAFLFAVLHVGYLSIPETFFVFGVALFFGWVVKQTGSLLGVTLSHGMNNILLWLVLPLL